MNWHIIQINIESSKYIYCLLIINDHIKMTPALKECFECCIILIALQLAIKFVRVLHLAVKFECLRNVSMNEIRNSLFRHLKFTEGIFDFLMMQNFLYWFWIKLLWFNYYKNLQNFNFNQLILKAIKIKIKNYFQTHLYAPLQRSQLRQWQLI